MEQFKKYPIKYKGKEYEVRFTKSANGKYIDIYEVEKYKNVFRKVRKKYKKIYNFYSGVENWGFTKSYVETTKEAFEEYERSILKKERKHKIVSEREEKEANRRKELEEWDGIIKEEN